MIQNCSNVFTDLSKKGLCKAKREVERELLYRLSGTQGKENSK